MKQVKDVITQQQAESGQTYSANSQKSNRDNERAKILRLWQLMGSLYGHKWTTAYGDEADPDRVWQATLTGVSEEQIRLAMGELAKRGDEWPPSAPEFRRLCSGSDEWQHKVMAAKDKEIAEWPKALPLKKTPEQQEKAATAIAEMRAMLKNSKMGTEKKTI